MLTLENMTITQGDFSLRAALSVPQGEIVAVLGPSGAGKSTLLAGIGGYIEVQGRVMWADDDLTPLPPSARPITTLFQDANIFPHLTVEQNVGLGLSPSLKLSMADKNLISHALERVGLPGMVARKPALLSGGQAARVALARALVRHRPLMLLDEPFGALGPALRAEMLDRVKEVAEETGATVLMVSHEPEDARRIARQVILVADNRAHAPVPTDEIFDNPPEALRDYLGT